VTPYLSPQRRKKKMKISVIIVLMKKDGGIKEPDVVLDVIKRAGDTEILVNISKLHFYLYSFVFLLIFKFGLGLCCLMPLSTIFSYIVAVSFIVGGNQSTWKNPPTCSKSLTNLIT
jgi:hypothetical protein